MVHPSFTGSLHVNLSLLFGGKSCKAQEGGPGKMSSSLRRFPPNCFNQLLVTFIGYKGESSEVGSTAGEETEEESDLLTAFCKVIQKSPAAATVPEQKPAQTLAATSTLKASTTENIRHQATPTMTRAIIFRPGHDEKQWSRTGLSQEYHPHHDGGKYSYPLCPPSEYEPKGNIDTVATHIR